MWPLKYNFPSSSKTQGDTGERRPAPVLNRAVWLHFLKGMIKRLNNKWHLRSFLMRYRKTVQVRRKGERERLSVSDNPDQG